MNFDAVNSLVYIVFATISILNCQLLFYRHDSVVVVLALEVEVVDWVKL